mgnify:CR=1 FL=1|jgi:hypothetical protein
MKDLLDLLCSRHAWERWLERSDLAHPKHNREFVVSYVRTHCSFIPPDVGVHVLRMVDKDLWKTHSIALKHWHFWDGSDLLFILIPAFVGLEQRNYPTVRTMVCLTLEQERELRSIMEEIEDGTTDR